MLHPYITLLVVRERQEALRRTATPPGARGRPVRRRVGAWLVRLGRAIGGPATSSPAWQS